MESNTYFKGCFTMRNNGWIKGIALVIILLGVFTNWICGEDPVASTPDDQEIVEVFVFYEYGPETTFKVYDEYSNEDDIYYEAFDCDGTCLGSGYLDREDLINKLF